MSFALPQEAVRWRDKARDFVIRELIPFEVEAEMNEGRIPDTARKAHEKACIDMGLTLMDVPQDQGGLALPILTQAAVVEQFGRVTNALGWCYGEAQGWMFEACNADQVDAHPADDARRNSSLLRDHRGECRLRSLSDRDHGDTDGDVYLISGEKWHVTSYNLASHVIVQAKLEGGA